VWNHGIARELAAEENLQLTGNYWQILNIMRTCRGGHKMAPDVRHVVGYLVNTLVLSVISVPEGLLQVIRNVACVAWLFILPVVTLCKSRLQ
jgi:hypothetical protein